MSAIIYVNRVLNWCKKVRTESPMMLFRFPNRVQWVRDVPRELARTRGTIWPIGVFPWAEFIGISC